MRCTIYYSRHLFAFSARPSHLSGNKQNFADLLSFTKMLKTTAKTARDLRKLLRALFISSGFFPGTRVRATSTAFLSFSLFLVVDVTECVKLFRPAYVITKLIRILEMREIAKEAWAMRPNSRQRETEEVGKLSTRLRMY